MTQGAQNSSGTRPWNLRGACEAHKKNVDGAPILLGICPIGEGPVYKC